MIVHKGIARNPITSITHDIYDVHRHFKFAYFHFEDYTSNQFQQDMIKANQKYPKETFKQEHQDRFDFYPPYLIQDDLFQVFNYIFVITQYVTYLRNNVEHSQNSEFNLTVMIIPKAIISVYDPTLKLKYNINSISQYLERGVYGIIDELF